MWGIGELDPCWGAMLASLTSVRLTNASLSGTLPDAWAQSMPSLLTLVLDYNVIQGSLPESWGTEEAFPGLGLLSMQSNRLAGCKHMPHINNTPEVVHASLADAE